MYFCTDRKKNEMKANIAVADFENSILEKQNIISNKNVELEINKLEIKSNEENAFKENQNNQNLLNHDFPKERKLIESESLNIIVGKFKTKVNHDELLNLIKKYAFNCVGSAEFPAVEDLKISR